MDFIMSTTPATILALISDSRSRRNMLDMVINSVAAALERAGVKDADDPGEAIDVLVADKDAEIARLRDALSLLLEQFEPSNITEPVIMDNDQFSEFLKQVSINTDQAVAIARAALNKETK